MEQTFQIVQKCLAENTYHISQIHLIDIDFTSNYFTQFKHSGRSVVRTEILWAVQNGLRGKWIPKRILLVFSRILDSERNINGFADPAMVAVCGFHRTLGPDFRFQILLVIKFGSWISAIVRNIFFCLFCGLCVTVVFSVTVKAH